MAEYIERRAAIEHLNVWCGGCGSAVECILAEPAADVAPVVHGRWDRHGSSWYCNRCGIGYRITCGNIPANRHNYCPNCGAKMDGGDGDAAD